MMMAEDQNYSNDFELKFTTSRQGSANMSLSYVIISNGSYPV